MQKKLILLTSLTFILLGSSSLLFAHEFWLMPNKFRVKINELMTLTFYVGEDFTGEMWGKRKERTLKVTDFIGKKQTDLTNLAIQSDSNDIKLSFEKEGTHVLTMQSKNSFIALEAEKFNAYLKDDGIDNIYELRQKNGDLDKPSRELYSRCAKTLIQVGDKMDKTFKKNTGMPLEIIPLQNPYLAKIGDKMTVKVLFEGKSLADKMIVAWNKTATTKTRQQKLRTDAKGEMSFILDEKGQWMISTVQMIALANNPEANYQSYWGNLTFEF
jgi:uncharacterized GH25 family protein